MNKGSSCCGNEKERELPCNCNSDTVVKNATAKALPDIDRRGDILCRLSNNFRMHFSVEPGLYSIGNPDESSVVLVTANYRLTCDNLRKAMDKNDAWVLVLDTKGINVWCAAGKGTFGTSELINRIRSCDLASIVKHRKLILPQLGAPGVSAHEVAKNTGFKVSYGPVRAADIPQYIKAGEIATDNMRKVEFNLNDRIVLIPMEFFPALIKFSWVALFIMILMGLQPEGILYNPALFHSWKIILLGLVSVISATALLPVLLPFLPFRSFALKGAVLGLIVTAPSLFFVNNIYLGNVYFASAVIIFYTTLISYLALNFTGCTTFTNISGVKREMRFSIPVYISACVVSLTFLVIFKLQEWSVL